MKKPAYNYTKIIIGTLMIIGSLGKLLNVSNIDAGGGRYVYIIITVLMLLAGCSLLYTGLVLTKGTPATQKVKLEK